MEGYEHWYIQFSKEVEVFQSESKANYGHFCQSSENNTEQSMVWEVLMNIHVQ